jgi:hypothetical protein
MGKKKDAAEAAFYRKIATIEHYEAAIAGAEGVASSHRKRAQFHHDLATAADELADAIEAEAKE